VAKIQRIFVGVVQEYFLHNDLHFNHFDCVGPNLSMLTLKAMLRFLPEWQSGCFRVVGFESMSIWWLSGAEATI
jgi:hypothetical protein